MLFPQVDEGCFAMFPNGADSANHLLDAWRLDLRVRLIRLLEGSIFGGELGE